MSNVTIRYIRRKISGLWYVIRKNSV